MLPCRKRLIYKCLLMARVNREYRIVDAASARYASSIRVRMRFFVETETLDAEAARQLGRELTRLSQECGCNNGARFLMISIFAWAVAAIILWKSWWPHPILCLLPYLFGKRRAYTSKVKSM